MTDRSILLIEESGLSQSSLARVFTRSEFSVHVVHSGIEGLSLLSKKRFDILICQQNLPDISGMTVIRNLRELRNYGLIPTILLSEEPDSISFGEREALGISTVMARSAIVPREFVEAVEQLTSPLDLLHDVELLTLEVPEEEWPSLRESFPEDRFELCRVDDREELGALPVSLSPDAVIFAIGAEELSENSWILRAQHRGSLKNIPWVISAPAGSGKILNSQFQNRLIHIVEDQLGSDALRRGVELMIRLQRSRTAAEEAKLELDIAYAEMEKNREALKSARTEIQQRKKNTGEALLKVAREVQHPLTAMLAYADSVARSGELPDSLRCAISRICSNGKYISQIAEDLLSVASIEKGFFSTQKRSFDTMALLSEIARLVHPRAEAANLPFVIQFENDIPTEIFSDPSLIRQMLRGLLDNALKYTETGRISLQLRFEQGYNQLHFSVVDTGPGVRMDLLGGSLNRSISATEINEQLSKGKGWGISFVQFAANRLGGQLSVESEPAEGSAFSFSVDVGEVDDLCSPELAHTMIELSAGPVDASASMLRGKVMVLDSSHENIRLFEYLLGGRKSGVQLYTSKDPLEVLQKAADEAYSLLIIDALDTDLDSLGLVKSLRKRGFKGKVLAVSLFAFEAQRQRCLDIGCDALLDKPFSVGQLQAELASLLTEVAPTEESAQMNVRNLPNDSSEAIAVKQQGDLRQPAEDSESQQLDLQDSGERKALEAELQTLFDAPLAARTDSPSDELSLASTAADLELPELETPENSFFLENEFGEVEEVLGTGYFLKQLRDADSDIENHSERESSASQPIKAGGVNEADDNGESARRAVVESTASSLEESIMTSLLSATSSGRFPVPKELFAESEDESAAATEPEQPQRLATESSEDLESCSIENQLIRELLVLETNASQNEPIQIAESSPNADSESSTADRLQDRQSIQTNPMFDFFRQELPSLQARLSLLKSAAVSKDWYAAKELLFEITGAVHILGIDEFRKPISQMMSACNQRDTKRLLAYADNFADELLSCFDSDENQQSSDAEQSKNEALHSELLQNEPQMAPLILSFLDELKDLMHKIQVSYDKQDFDTIADVAGQVYGAAGLCGFPSCAEAARDLKSASTRKDQSALMPRLERFGEVYEAMQLGAEQLGG